MPNTNPKTEIPYGTIYLNHLDPEIADALFYGGTNVSIKEAYVDLSNELEAEADEIEEEARIAVVERDGNLPDPTYEAILENEVENAYLRRGYGDREAFIEGEFDKRRDRIEIDEPLIEGVRDGVTYSIDWLGGAPLLWVLESPHTGLYQLCSPCVPGAGNLDAPDAFGFTCYDVPNEWRRDHAEQN